VLSFCCLCLLIPVDERQCGTITVRDGLVLVPDAAVGKLLGHTMPAIRIAALSLLVSSSHISRPLTGGALKYLRLHIHHLVAEVDANFRGEYLSLLKRLLERLRASIYMLDRQHRAARTLKLSGRENSEDDFSEQQNAASKLLGHHYRFIDWLVRSKLLDIRPTASYQRRITCLQSILLMLKFGMDSRASTQTKAKRAKTEVDWLRSWDILNPWLMRSALDLLMDPFDDIRQIAALIVKSGLHCHYDLFGSQTRQCPPGIQRPLIMSPSFQTFTRRAERTMLRTGRADHADGVARTFEIVCSFVSSPFPDSETGRGIAQLTRRLNTLHSLTVKLKYTIQFAAADMGSAVTQHPMHGTLASMK
jgi:hypothetical protein